MSAPLKSPVLARTSSAASGFRFCGMIELPVVKASLSRIKPKASLDQMTTSSAKRDKCVPASAAAARNSTAKSRSETASIEFADGRSKPSAAAVRSRSIGKAVPASEAAATIGEAATVAPEHLDIGHQMVAESHWLRDLQMRKAGHDAIGMCLGLTEKRALTFPERGIEAVDCVANPETKNGRHLIVARPRGVQAARHRPDQLGEPRLDIEMDVLVLVAEDKAPRLDLAADL